MDGAATSIAPMAKIRLKVGSMELEYEGDPSFLTGGIEALLMTMGSLVCKMPNEPLPTELAVEVPPTIGSGSGVTPTDNRQFTISTNTIAANLLAKSGSDLVICAMAHLELVQGKMSSGRAEILAEMKNAKQYYKQSMSKNLSKSFATLLGAKRINEGAKDSYALTASERKQIEAKLAAIG